MTPSPAFEAANAGGVPASTAGVYGISVAAELSGCGTQALRLYEQRGLIEPARTDGGTRRYSQDNVTQARRIVRMLGEGLNLAGVVEIFQLERELAMVKAELAAARERLAETAP